MQKSKIFIVSFFLIIASFFVFSDPEVIKLDYLVSGDWGQEFSSMGAQIGFHKDYTCDININYGMDFEHKKGVFEIEGNYYVTIYSENKEKVLYESGTLHSAPDSPIYQKYLAFSDDTIIWNQKTTLKPDTKIIINNAKCVTLGYKKGKILTNVKFRVLPDAKADIIQYTDLKDSPDGPPDEVMIQYVPQGKEIMVFARTENKVKVGNWNNYWYYVFVKDGMGFTGKKGWMYAEFIEIIK